MKAGRQAAGLVIVLLACTEAGAQALTPEDVLRSVTRALPLLEQARQEVAIARAESIEARGAFDLKVKGDTLSQRGVYDNDRAKAQLEQPLAASGLSLFGGYRAGQGVFAPYDGKAQTLSDGEVSGGFELPLLRGRATDERRAQRQSAEIGAEVAERGFDKARLTSYKDALAEYWDWVAAGEQLRIARALLDLADTRDRQLADAVAVGQVAPVERTDNRRAILQRRSALATAQRYLEQQTIDLSLYLRDQQGRPVRPALTRLPSLPDPAVPPVDGDEDMHVRRALERRPEIAALRLKRQQQGVALDLARNSLLPDLSLFSQISRDFGTGAPTRAGASFETGLSFALPLQRRKATGKTLQAQAKMLVVDQELRWAEDLIRADVQDAISAIGASRAVLDVITEEVTVARELESLERDRFLLGDSTQFLVNLRELATADAALREARARADYQKALVTLDVVTGRLLDRVP